VVDAVSAGLKPRPSGNPKEYPGLVRNPG